MRIRALAVVGLLSALAMLPLAGVAAADDEPAARDCVSRLRDRVRDLDARELRERLRDGERAWPAPWSEEWRRELLRCRSLERAPDVEHDSEGDDRPDRAGSDRDRVDGAGTGGDGTGGGGHGHDEGDGGSPGTTQVTIVPKGSVDTGDGSVR